MKVVLVGHGSIGTRYKKKLVTSLMPEDELYIVDTNESIVKGLVEEGFNAYPSLLELSHKNIQITHGIIANWGPEHIKTANFLIDLGAKMHIINKITINIISNRS